MNTTQLVNLVNNTDTEFKPPLNPRPIVKGSVVRRRNGGWMRVTAKYKTTVNLGPVWGGRGRFSGIIKDIPLGDVYEDGDAQYENWTKSESYMCM